MPQSSATIFLLDGHSLGSEPEGPALVVLPISRAEIEAGNIASALERLHSLAESREAVYRYRESLVFMVEGYDADRRELPEIPQVRAYFARLTAQWPHWLWFLCRGMGSIGLLLSLLCKVKVRRNKGGDFGTEFFSAEEVHRRLIDMLMRGNAMFDAFGITQEESKASLDSALAEL